MKYKITFHWEYLECIWRAEVAGTGINCYADTKKEAMQKACRCHYDWIIKGDLSTVFY